MVKRAAGHRAQPVCFSTTQCNNGEQDWELDKPMESESKRERERQTAIGGTKGALVCITSFSCLFTPHLSLMRPCNRLLMPLHDNHTHTHTYSWCTSSLVQVHTQCSDLAQNWWLMLTACSQFKVEDNCNSWNILVHFMSVSFLLFCSLFLHLLSIDPPFYSFLKNFLIWTVTLVQLPQEKKNNFTVLKREIKCEIQLHRAHL